MVVSVLFVYPCDHVFTGVAAPCCCSTWWEYILPHIISPGKKSQNLKYNF